MHSTGNDIVSLDLINKERSNNSRFYLKILTPSEEALSRQPELGHVMFEHFLWLCWSVKESAFKYLKRENPPLVFSPVKIVIREIKVPSGKQDPLINKKDWEGDASGEENYHGSLIAEGNIYYFRSKISQSTIATVVSEDKDFTGVLWGISNIDHANADHQSEKVRSFVLRRLQTFFPGKALRIEKTQGGYPVIMEGKNEWELPVSFAHHGKAISYSISLGA